MFTLNVFEQARIERAKFIVDAVQALRDEQVFLLASIRHRMADEIRQSNEEDRDSLIAMVKTLPPCETRDELMDKIEAEYGLPCRHQWSSGYDEETDAEVGIYCLLCGESGDM